MAIPHHFGPVPPAALQRFLNGTVAAHERITWRGLLWFLRMWRDWIGRPRRAIRCFLRGHVWDTWEGPILLEASSRIWACRRRCLRCRGAILVRISEDLVEDVRDQPSLLPAEES